MTIQWLAGVCAFPLVLAAQSELHLPLRVLYASDPGTDYSAGWAGFLEEHVDEVRTVAHAELSPDLVRAFDVLVVDGELQEGENYKPGRVELPLRLSQLQGHPVLLMGGVGGQVSTQWRLAGTWGLWGCHCLMPWLVVPPKEEQHAMLRAPFPIDEEVRRVAAPKVYLEHDPDSPSRLDVLRVFARDPSEPGFVTQGGFRELPDAEWIASGLNSKSAGHAAILRHGSFVLWGFHGSAADLTPVGVKLYLDALAYARAHAGALVENLRLTSPREELLTFYQRIAPGVEREERGKELAWLLSTGFPDSVLDDPASAPAWFASIRGELRGLHSDLGFEQDRLCAELGQANDSPQFVAELAARLERSPGDALALELLARYVPAAPRTGAAEWLRTHQGELAFTDVGGFVWKPRGERADALHALRVTGLAQDCPVSVAASANEEEVVLEIGLRAGWHLYARKEESFAPLALSASADSGYELAPIDLPADDRGWLSGRKTLRWLLRRKGWGGDMAFELTFQACDADSCRLVETVRIAR